MATRFRQLFWRWLGRHADDGLAEPTVPEALFQAGDLVLTTSGASRERGAQVLGNRGPSEDAGLLVLPEAARRRSDPPAEERDYGPHPEAEWALDLVWAKPVVVTTAELDAAFPRGALIGERGFTLYGTPAGGERWTYVHAGGVPTRWRAVAISTELLDTDVDAAPAGPGALRSFQADVARRAATIHGARVDAREPVDAAADRAQRFAAARRDASGDALVVLRAPAAGFEGRQVWDALASVGLEWGDMDLFHWSNPSDVGHDSFFDVWTSTPPGYFLPEPIRAGGVRFGDLVFGFQIARSADPHAVLGQMVEAARYVQRRLGGAVEDDQGAAYDEAAAHARVRLVVERLALAGLRPGAGTTLRLF